MDEEGRQIQATGHDGARPFNKQEQQRISRVGTCIACHDAQTNPALWKKTRARVGLAPNDAVHSSVLRKLLRGGSSSTAPHQVKCAKYDCRDSESPCGFKQHSKPKLGIASGESLGKPASHTRNKIALRDSYE